MPLKNTGCTRFPQMIGDNARHWYSSQETWLLSHGVDNTLTIEALLASHISGRTLQGYSNGEESWTVAQFSKYTTLTFFKTLDVDKVSNKAFLCFILVAAAYLLILLHLWLLLMRLSTFYFNLCAFLKIPLWPGNDIEELFGLEFSHSCGGILSFSNVAQSNVKSSDYYIISKINATFKAFCMQRE